MRFVLEQVEPVLAFAIHVHRALDRTGVDLFGFVEPGKDALRLEVARADGAHVHEAHGLLVASELMAHGEVFLERSLHRFVIDRLHGELGAERGVAAMIRPVRVDHLDLGDRGIAILFDEVLLAERDVGKIHGKSALGDEGGESRFVEVEKSFDRLHHRGNRLSHMKRRTHVERCFARLDRIDHVALDGLDIGLGQLAFEQVHLRAAHLGALSAGDELNALARRIGTLIELAGKVLHRKHMRAPRLGHFRCGDIRLRLAEHRGHALGEQLV